MKLKIVVHKENKVLRILDESLKKVNHLPDKSIAGSLFSLANSYPNQIILWCHDDLINLIAMNNIDEIFHHDFILASFKISKDLSQLKDIGFVDDSIFMNVKFDVPFPTWQMSVDIGGISSNFLNSITKLSLSEDFNFFLLSLAKLSMPKGLFCYSDPRLINNLNLERINKDELSLNFIYRFVRQHYKFKWVFFLLLFHLRQGKYMAVFAMLKSMFYKPRTIEFPNLKIESRKKNDGENTMDVIIPTIGRRKYLYDVLVDLSKQSLLPKKVIIVEQNPNINSKSELDYINDRQWPFEIAHIFTHRAGVCNARNIGLKYVTSQWVFFNDDDNRFNSELLESALKKIKSLSVKVLLTKYLQKNENLSNQYNYTHQTGIFGAGNAILHSDCLLNNSFDSSLEHGYGEDYDFGVQLRNMGFDIIFSPQLEIVHLKAKIGGFRSFVKKPWDHLDLKPQPSPTIMLVNLRHKTKEQFDNYKLRFFLSNWLRDRDVNFIQYLKRFKKRWNLSVYWADKIYESK